MEDWKEIRLGDYVQFQNGYAFKSSDFKSDGKYKIIKIKELKDGLVKFFDDTANVDCENPDIINKYKVEKNDVLFALTGDPVSKPNPLSWVGRVSINRNDDKALLNQRTCKILKSNKIDNIFLYYYFRQWENFFSLASKATGSASQANISTSTIGDTVINLPPLPTQQKIAQILSSLDDKIELNNKINANLEQQAQALFKSWFVDFENSSDFTKKTLNEVTENLRERILDQNTPVLSAVNTGCLQRSDDYFSKQVYSKDISKYILVKIGDFAYNPARINIGSIGINDFDYDGCVSPVYVAFSVDPSYKSFFKCYFKSNLFKEETKTRASGSVRQSLNYDDFAKIQINYPSRELASKFEEFYTSIESSIKRIKKENETLISIRDTLLPKLMNGEIEV